MTKTTVMLLVLALSGAAAVYWGSSFVPAPSPSGAAALELERRYRSGVELLRLGQVDRAAAELDRVLELDPRRAEAIFQEGRVLLFRGKPDEAARTFEEALRLAPGDERFHRFLLELRSRPGPLFDEEKAREHYRVLEGSMGDLLGFDLEVAMERLSREGVEPYTVAAMKLRASPGSPALGALERAFFAAGPSSLEIQGIPGFPEFRRLFERHPGLFTLKEALAERLSSPSRFGLPEVGDDRLPGSTIPLEIAQAYVEELIDYSVPGSERALDLSARLARISMMMGDYPEAIRRFRNLLEVAGARKAVLRQVRFFLGSCCYRTGRDEEARSLFRKIRETHPRDVGATWFLYLLGEVTPPFRVEETGSRASFRFSDRAAELGVAKEDAGGTSAWGDYDGDGDLDLFVSGCDTYSILYRNEGGRFVDASRSAGLGKVASGFSNVFVDYDADGDQDLFVCRDGWAGPGPNSLYQNRGDGTFRDVSKESGIGSGPEGSSFTSAWSDFDRDGDLDLFVTNGVCGDGSTNRLYSNRGDGTFADTTRAAGLEEKRGVRTIGCAVGDYDLDGWPDIFLSGFEPAPNRLYHNRGDGTFEEVAERAGVADKRHKAAGFVAFFSDLSGDGLPDIFVTKWEPDFEAVQFAMMESYRPRRRFLRTTPRFFRNRGDGTFEDVSEDAGFLYPHGTMGAGIADLDHDGYLDLYLGNGGPDLERLEPDSVYVSLGGRRFVEAGRRIGMAHVGKGHGVSFADFDRDGDLDVYVPLGGAFHGDFWKNAFYINEVERSGHWLQLSLSGRESDATAVGAQVTLRAGPLTVFRERKCGVGFGASDTPYLHFGLGEATAADRLEVRWPSGRVDAFSGVLADRFYRLREGGELEEETR